MKLKPEQSPLIKKKAKQRRLVEASSNKKSTQNIIAELHNLKRNVISFA